MLQIVNKATAKEKLKTLDELAYSVSIHKEGIKYLKIFEQESILQSNQEMLAKCYSYLSDYYYFIAIKNDSALYYLDKASEIGINEEMRIQGNRNRLSIYLMEGKNTLALYHVKKMLEDKSIQKGSIEEAAIYTDLGVFYNTVENYKESIIAFKKSMDILKQNPAESSIGHKIDNYMVLPDCYTKMEMYDIALSSADTLHVLIDEMEKYDTEALAPYNLYRTLIYRLKADTYLKMEDMDKARLNLDSLRSIIISNPTFIAGVDSMYYLSLESRYYLQKKEFHKALEYIDISLNLVPKGIGNYWKLLSFYRIKSDILHGMNKENEAYDLVKKILYKTDSINHVKLLSQVYELQTIYEVDEIKNERDMKTAQLERTKVIAIALLGISLLLLILFIITKRNKREREKRNRKIHEQYQLMKTYLGQIRTQREELELSKQKEENNTIINWAEKAHHYLLKTEAFKKEDLSRDDLATALGTNRQYLIDAIKNETGKTFKDYINSIRIEYAYEMLITDWDATIESIYLAAGFTTRSTFNRLFKEQYGMNPIEMREAAKQIEKELVGEIKDLDE